VVNDVATERAPGFALLHLEGGRRWTLPGGELRAFARLENVLDQAYIGSVIVNDGNGRFYEPGPGRRGQRRPAMVVALKVVPAAGRHRAVQDVRRLPASGRHYPSVGGLGWHERRCRVAGREGLLQRLVLVVAGALLAFAALERAFLATRWRSPPSLRSCAACSASCFTGRWSLPSPSKNGAPVPR
jgi:hypothetical protein